MRVDIHHGIVVRVDRMLVDDNRRPRHETGFVIVVGNAVIKRCIQLIRSAPAKERLVDLWRVNTHRHIALERRAHGSGILETVFAFDALIVVPKSPEAVVLGVQKFRAGMGKILPAFLEADKERLVAAQHLAAYPQHRRLPVGIAVAARARKIPLAIRLCRSADAGFGKVAVFVDARAKPLPCLRDRRSETLLVEPAVPYTRRHRVGKHCRAGRFRP